MSANRERLSSKQNFVDLANKCLKYVVNKQVTTKTKTIQGQKLDRMFTFEWSTAL